MWAFCVVFVIEEFMFRRAGLCMERKALLLMKEDIRTSGMHEFLEDFRRDISISTIGYVVKNLRAASQNKSNIANRTYANLNNDVTKANVPPKIITTDYNSTKISKNDNNITEKLHLHAGYNTTGLQIERIPSIAHKLKLAINNVTHVHNNEPSVVTVNESVIIKQTLQEIMNLNVSLDKRDDVTNNTSSGIVFLENSTTGLMNFRSIDQNSTANNETALESVYSNSTSDNDTKLFSSRREFEPGSLKSFYIKDIDKSGNKNGKHGDKKHETKTTVHNIKRRYRAGPVSLETETFTPKRREFVLDSLKSIYTKHIKKDFNSTTNRNLTIPLFNIPFSITDEDETVHNNVTVAEKSVEPQNISKSVQKLNAVLFKIPQIMSQINETIGNSSLTNITFHRATRVFIPHNFKSKYSTNDTINLNLSTVKNSGDFLKHVASLAMQASTYKINEVTKRLSESKPSINETEASVVQDISTTKRQDLNRRNQPRENLENIKSVIDLDVFKKLMEAARQNKNVRKIPFKTSTIDTAANFKEGSGETKFVNVWREAYLKPKAKLTQKTGALINLINKLNWKLAKSDKRAMENIYGPAANQSLVPQFRRLWDFFWDWYYDPDNPYFMEEYNVIYTNETASVPFNIGSNFMDPLLGRNHNGTLYQHSKRWRGHYYTIVPTRINDRTPTVDPPWRRHVVENPEVVHEFRKNLYNTIKRKKKKKRKKPLSTSSSDPSSSGEAYFDRRDGKSLYGAFDFDSVEENKSKPKRSQNSMRRNHPTTKFVPSTKNMPSESFELTTARYGALDKPILRTEKVEWEVYDAQDGNENNMQNKKASKVILLDSQWAKGTVPVANIRKSPINFEKMKEMTYTSSEDRYKNLASDLFGSFLRSNASNIKKPTDDDLIDVKLERTAVNVVADWLKKKNIDPDLNKREVWEQETERLDDETEDEHAKFEDEYEIEEEEKLEQYDDEDKKGLEDVEQPKGSQELIHEEDERDERIDKENDAIEQGEDDNQEDKIEAGEKQQNERLEEQEKEKEERYKPRQSRLDGPKEQEWHVQQDKQERHEREEKRIRQIDQDRHERTPNEQKHQERIDKSERQERQESGQGRNEAQAREDMPERPEGQEKLEQQQSQVMQEREPSQKIPDRYEVQQRPERLKEKSDRSERSKSQYKTERLDRVEGPRNEGHKAHERQQEEESEERSSRVQEILKVQERSERERDTKNGREEPNDDKIIQFEVNSHKDRISEPQPIKKQFESGEGSLKKDTFLDDDKMGSKYGRKMKKRIPDSKEDIKLKDGNIGWASGEKKKDSWEKNDKKDDDWGKKKDDDWDKNKDDDWDDKKKDDWVKKKDDDWDKKKDDNGDKKKDDSWDKKKDDNWDKKIDDDWDKKKNDDWGKKNDDDWNKKKDDDWDKKKDDNEKTEWDDYEKGLNAEKKVGRIGSLAKTTRNDNWDNVKPDKKNDWGKPGIKQKDSWDDKKLKDDWDTPKRENNDWGSPKKSKNDDWDSPKKGNNDWGSNKKSKIDDWDSPKKSKNDDWDSPKKSKNDDWGTPVKAKGDDWDSPKKSKNNDWDSPKNSKIDDWDSPKKSKNDDWDSPKKSKNDDWGTPVKAKKDDWDSPKKSKIDDWDNPKNPKNGDWDDSPKKKIYDYDTSNKRTRDDYGPPKKSNIGNWDSPKKSHDDYGGGKKIGNDRPKPNRQKASIWERPPKDEIPAPILPKLKYKQSKFNYGPSLKQYGYMHTPIPVSGKKVIYDE